MKKNFLHLISLIVVFALVACQPIQAPTPVATPASEVVTTPAAAPAVAAEATVPELTGQWQGAIAIANLELDITVRFTADGDALAGTIDIPQQGASALPLHDIRVELPAIHFELLDGPQLANFDGMVDGTGVISGTFAQSGAEGSFTLTRSDAEAEAAPATQALTETVYSDPAGLFSVPIPINWSATPGDESVLLTDPANLIKVYILTLENTDLEAALADAWSRVDPAFELPIDQAQTPPASGGVESALVNTYDTGDENRVVQAVGQLYEGVSYLMLFDADLVAVQQRSSQLSIIQTGFKITGLEKTDLSTVTPLPITDAMIAELETYVKDKLAQFGIPGAAVAIVQDGEMIYANGFGVSNPETGAAMTSATRMMIGSTSKTMTTMMMATLVDDNLMAWDTPVVEILPSFAVADPVITQQLTMRHTVCACTGVPRRDFELIFNASELSAEAIIESLSTFEFFTDFGEAFQYSNQMVAAGGYIATIAAGGQVGDLYADYATTMQERVIDPIGMPSTTLDFAVVEASGDYAIPHGLTLGYEYTPIPLAEEQFATPIAPAGAYWSTVEDMARYLITELNQGISPDGEPVVSAENLAVTWTPQVSITVAASYGLGWIIGDYKGQPMIEHGGNTFGFTSDLVFLPQANLGISILANAQTANLFTQAVRYRLLELVFDQPSELDAQITFAHDAAQKATDELHQKLADQVDTAAVEPYLGRFTSNVLGSMDVTLNGDNMALLADIGEFVAELRPQLNDEGEIENYVMYNPPAAGLAVKLAEDDDGKPTIVIGTGVVEYTFVKTE